MHKRKVFSLTVLLILGVSTFMIKHSDIAIKYIFVKDESHTIINGTVPVIFRGNESNIVYSDLYSILNNITIELSALRNMMLLDIQHNRVNKNKIFGMQKREPEKIIIANNDSKYWESVNRLSIVKSISYMCSLNPEEKSDSIPMCTRSNTMYKTIISSCNSSSRQCWENINSTLLETHQRQKVLNSKFTPQAFFLHAIPYGIIDQYGNVRSGEAVITPCACHFNMMDGTRSKTDFNQPKEEVFVISQFWGYGYFHFTIENLPRVSAYIEFLQKYTHIKIHVNAKKGFIGQTVPSFVGQFLTILGIDPSRIVSGNVLGRIVYLPQGGCCGTISQPSGHILTTYFYKYIQTFKKYIHSLDRRKITLPGAIKIQNHRNLILIKRKSRRWLKDHDNIALELQGKAAKIGLNFLIYDDSDLPNLEQTMLMFYNAVLVVGPHGAGLSNILFCRPDTFIIELLCKAELVLCYKDLAEKQGMHYYGLLATKFESPYLDKKKCGSMTFNLEALYASVDFYLNQT